MKKISWVKAGEKWIDLNDKGVEFEDVEEDVYGRDLITFSYLGQTYQSVCISSYSRP